MRRNAPRAAIATAYTLISAIALILVSCSSGNPEIRGKNVKLLLVEGAEGVFAERLSVFTLYDDADGPADFAFMTVTHDKTGLSWTVDARIAEVRARGKDRWVGSASLAGPAGERVPVGRYALTVSDLAGNETSSDFEVGSVEFPERSPCSFSISGETWTIERNPGAGSFRHLWIILYDRDGKLVNSWKVPESGQQTIAGFVKTLTAVAPTAVAARCYCENDSGKAGVLLTPVDMR
jgi:hypothetical protein